MPSGTILYRRRTLYIHGLLFLLLAVGAFAAGYFVGKGDAMRQFQEQPSGGASVPAGPDSRSNTPPAPDPAGSQQTPDPAMSAEPARQTEPQSIQDTRDDQ
jgi:hypothetical protein